MGIRAFSRPRLLRARSLPHRRQLSKLLLVCLLVTSPQLLPGALGGSTAAAEQSPTCGPASLAELRDLIGPTIVGECLDQQRYTRADGDTVQATTNGLLIANAAD